MKKIKKYLYTELLTMDAVEIYKLVLNEDILRFPKGFWQKPEAKQNAIKCTKYLVEEVLKLDRNTMGGKITANSFKKIN